MDVLSISPFCAGSVLWRPRPDRFSLTVVCKATYALAPGTSSLAPEQELVRDRDAYCDDDPRRSLYAPSDLAPFKPRADIVLVGHAYAPRSELVRSLVARLMVGDLEKAVEVFCPRVASREGELREGPRWNKMPLRYEYSAGGVETWNPVGVSPSAPADMYGQHPLPHMVPQGLRVSQWIDNFIPIGFGPLAPTWRVRRDKLGRRAEGWSDEGWTGLALDDDFDGEFFQCAPADQQLDALRDDERIVIEYLNPDHPSLATVLPGVHPHAFVELPGMPTRDLVMTADTLWIDTDRSLCTLTWRGQVAVDGPDQPGRVLIAMEEAGQRLNWQQAVAVSSRSMAIEVEGGRVQRQTLPFVGAPDAPPAMPPPPGYPAAPQGPYPPPPTPRTGAIAEAPRSMGRAQTLQMVSPEVPPPPQPSQPSQAQRRAQLGPGFQLGAQSLRTIEPTQVSMRIEDIRGPARSVPVPSVPVPSAPAPAPAPAKTVTEVPPATPPMMPAAALPPPPPPPTPAIQQPPVTPPMQPAAPPPTQAAAQQAKPSQVQGALEILWFAPSLAARARRVPAWEALLPPPKDGAAEIEIATLLSRATASAGDPARLLFEGVNEGGALSPSPLVFAGDLSFPFDEVASLRALIVAATPASREDPRLGEILEVAAEMAKTPLHCAPEVATGLCATIHEAWAQANRGLPADHLARQTQRALLAQRAYQKRDLLGKHWVRALLAAEGRVTPALLPASIAPRLPLFTSFAARVVADVLPKQDQFEESTVVLRVGAVARVVGREG